MLKAQLRFVVIYEVLDIAKLNFVGPHVIDEKEQKSDKEDSQLPDTSLTTLFFTINVSRRRSSDSLLNLIAGSGTYFKVGLLDAKTFYLRMSGRLSFFAFAFFAFSVF
eukprot:TRINITY_DN2001_c0_g1_i2.p1 TRINITY_DN2001_c0_g1~~TRINITY_DN2001_c0_g1_i2.p1  ORF type:complete len:108 (-),score=20.74 TRINITY_DN2001_c0_g1_i2:42-365(-)